MTSPGPALSVVIPVRNDALRLRGCLDSIAANTAHVPLEIVIADNGSTDDSATVGVNAGATVLPLPHYSVAQLRNLAARQSHAPLIAFVDADHVIDPGWVRTALDVFHDPSVAAAGAPCSPPPEANWIQRAYDRFRPALSVAQPTEWLGSGNLVVRREAFEKVGGFDPTLETCEDVDLCNRLRAAGYQLLAEPRLRSVHLGDPSTLRALFFGELWRGRNNFKVTVRGPWTLRALPSLLIPMVDLLCLVVLAAAPWAGRRAAAAAVLTFGALTVVRTVRMSVARRGLRLRDVAGNVVVATVYDLARALALVTRIRIARGGSSHARASMRERPLRILELRTVWGTGGGPEKTILLGTARTDPDRYAITVCYIRDERDAVFHIDERAQRLPVDYVEVRERHSFDHRIWPRLRDLVTSRKIDIIHAHDYKTNLLAWLLARITRAIPLSTAHGWTGHSKRERLVYYPGDRWVQSRLPHVIAVSTDIKTALVRAGAKPENVTVVLNAIDPEIFKRNRGRQAEARQQFGLAPSDFVLGSVGRLEPQKDFPLLITAFSRIAAECPMAKLVIAGDGSQRQALLDCISGLRLGERVHLLGHVHDVPFLHHALDLFVQSSIYEGTPNSVLEAMALETPIVATDAGGTAELTRDGREALIVPFRDETALVAALREAIRNDAARRDRASAARRRVETELSFDTRLRRVESIYDLLADRFLQPSYS